MEYLGCEKSPLNNAVGPFGIDEPIKVFLKGVMSKTSALFIAPYMDIASVG